jgi:hypothetical protein
VPPPLGFVLYNYHYCIVNCAFTLQELIETIEFILPFPYHPRNYRGGNPLLVLCLADRIPVKVQWLVPLVRLGLFIHYWFMDEMM